MLNGYDFNDHYFKLALTDPVNIYKNVQAAVPIEGGPKLKFIEMVSKNSEKLFKWGPQNLVPMNEKHL